MPPNLPPALFPQLTQIIQPHMTGPDERDAWLTQAFYLREPRLFNQIDRAGAPMVFTTRCIKVLLDFGCLASPTEHSLSALLRTLRYGCGTDKQTEIDTLVPLLDGLCSTGDSPPSPAPSRPTPPPALATHTTDTPISQRQPTVFISYSHQDAAFAERLICDLQAAGHAVWIDTSALKGGDEWIRAIAEGIINSYAFVIVATLRALQSPWVQDEITWAKQRGKRIIPALLENVVEAVEFFPLASYQGVKFYDTDYDAALPGLLTGLPAPHLPPPEGGTDAISPPVAPRQVTQRQRELQYLDRLRFEVLVNTEKYTPLAGESHFRQAESAHDIGPVVMRPEYALLARDREQRQAVRRFDNAVDELLRLRQAVVLGEPGAGKTTTLWKLTRQLADTAINDPQAPIPLVVRLGRWTDDGQPLEAFIAGELGELGRHLRELLETKRAALLLDGLNEIPVSQRRRDRSFKDAQVQRLIAAHPDLLAVVSCRAQDYTLDLGFDRVEIMPLDPGRILEFTTRYLGPKEGDALFWKIAGSLALKAVWAKWERAGASFDLFWSAPDIPHENPNIYRATTRQDNDLWREHARRPGSLLTLARNPYMLAMLAEVYVQRSDLPRNRGELFGSFVQTLLVREHLVAIDAVTRSPVGNPETHALLDGLAWLAYRMQVERGQAQDDDAVTSLPLAQARQFLDEKQLRQAGSASILSVSEAVRFTHQLLQEYFAAVQMDAEIQAGRLHAADIWRPGQWWKRTNWEEAAVLLAGLHAQDCTPVLEWVADANPEVAALCAARSGADVPARTLQGMQADWLPRLTGMKRDPQPAARAAVGRALGLLDLDNRPGVGLRADGLPDIAWCEIPAEKGGEIFVFGEGENEQRLAIPDTYWIAKYPVTYAQYAAFVDAGGYDRRDCWTGAGWAWKGDRAEPEYGWRDPTWHIANHPVIGVVWYEAYAFCQWLDRVAPKPAPGLTIRLATEAEWEKAARYPDGRAYPWGPAYSSGYANIDETMGKAGPHDLQRTTPVGMYPQGANPAHGAHDLSGNVWEWCLSKQAAEYTFPEDNDPEGKAERVLRGGSWNLSHYLARAAYRFKYYPFYWALHAGFRVVCGAAPS